MKPGSQPQALFTSAMLARRKGLATPGSRCALRALSSWSPRTMSATGAPSLPATIMVLRHCAGGTRSRALSSAMVRAAGVGTRVSGAPGAGRGAAGGSAAANSTLAAKWSASETAIASSPEAASTWNCSRAPATDRAGIGLYNAKIQPHTLKHTRVGGAHRGVALRQRAFVGMERVGVLHDEFAAAHDAKTRPYLVAELQLDLIEIDRQLAIALQFAPRNVGDHLFVRRADHKVTLVAILDAQ